MGDHSHHHIFLSFNQPRPIRENEVDTEHVLFGKHQPDVDQGNLAVDLEGGAVAADFTQAAEKCD